MTTATHTEAAVATRNGSAGALRADALVIPEEERPIVAARIVARLVSWGDGCWFLRPSQSKNGYGEIYVRGVRLRAHRAAYALINGPIPAGLFVCHRCDAPGCVRPDHLFLGTHLDNLRDMRLKGRARAASVDRRARGTAHGRARLTDADVVFIRLEGLRRSQSSLARELGVSRDAIRRVLKRITWTHIPDALAVPAAARKDRAA